MCWVGYGLIQGGVEMVIVLSKVVNNTTDREGVVEGDAVGDKVVKGPMSVIAWTSQKSTLYFCWDGFVTFEFPHRNSKSRKF